MTGTYQRDNMLHIDGIDGSIDACSIVPSDEHALRSLIKTYELALVRLDNQADALRLQSVIALTNTTGTRPTGPLNSATFTSSASPWSFFRTISTRKADPTDEKILLIQQEQEQLLRQIKHHQRLLAMARIQSIPVEIWAEIFFHLIPEDEFWHWDGFYNPIRLGSVCGYWRRIVISIPGLWCSLALQLEQLLYPSQKAILQLWMTRSGSMPLSFKLSWYSGRGQDAWFAENIYALLEPSFPRWRRLSLALPEHGVKRLLGPPLPSLEKLEVIMATSVHSPRITSSSSPFLHSFSVSGIYQDPRHFTIPWTQLTISNSQYCLRLPDAIELLRGCPHLEQCRMRIVTAEGPQPPLLMPKLVSLSLTSGTNEIPGFILHSLCLPSLSQLRLFQCSANTGLPWPKAEVLSLIARSSCDLKKLWVQNFPSCAGDAMECIENIRSLADLQITMNHRDIVTDHERELLRIRYYGQTLA